MTALLPLVVIGLLWWAARTTWRNLEATEVAQSVADDALDVLIPLEDRRRWNGRAAVRRLRALHVATGMAVPGVFALTPFVPGDLRDPASWPVVVVLVLLLVLLVLAVVQTSRWTTGSRPAGPPTPAWPSGTGSSRNTRSALTASAGCRGWRWR